VRIREAIILDSVEIKNDACIINAVIGWETKIGSWARIEGMPEYKEEKEGATDQGYKRPTASILGKAVVVNDELMVRDCIVLPHKEIKRSFHREIIM
jgi:mannose-1-phosphate guanylyltransferase